MFVYIMCLFFFFLFCKSTSFVFNRDVLFVQPLWGIGNRLRTIRGRPVEPSDPLSMCQKLREPIWFILNSRNPPDTPFIYVFMNLDTCVDIVAC